jgi:glycosyltransferase involved in cell wall biosynthesis
VSFNSVETIRDTIKSIISQDYENIEYILIDAGSTDGTLDIIKEYEGYINYFSSEEDDGIYDGMNKGISVASGEVVGILNSDDFYPNSYIVSNVARTFEKRNCDAVYGDLVYVKFYDTDKIVRYWQSGNYSVKKIKNGWMLPHPTFFVKREMYEKYGYYNTELKSAADYEMILKLLYKQNINVFYIPMILVKMRMGGKSNASIMNRIRANKEDGLAWTENQLNKPLFVRIKKPLQKIKQFFLKPKL